MRRIILALAAAAGLAFSVVAGPVLAGPVTSASAASSFRIESGWDGGYIWVYAHLDPASVEPSGLTQGSYSFVLTGQNGKYYEILTIDNNCLELYKSGSTYYVREDYCNGNSSELWWWDGNLIINDHGTSLLGHNACLWNNDGYNVNGPIWELVIVQKCASSNNRQNWFKN
jgi:hypothetical protein